MSICWDCPKRTACGRLYEQGEQQDYCPDREWAYQSYENYIKWLAKSGGFYDT